MQEKRILPENEQTLVSTIDGTYNPTIRCLFEYLRDNYTKEITLESAAAYMNMNSN